MASQTGLLGRLWLIQRINEIGLCLRDTISDAASGFGNKPEHACAHAVVHTSFDEAIVERMRRE